MKLVEGSASTVRLEGIAVQRWLNQRRSLDWRGWLALIWAAWFGVLYARMVVDQRAPRALRAISRASEPIKTTYK
jgi:hypothetical protein